MKEVMWVYRIFPFFDQGVSRGGAVAPRTLVTSPPLSR